MRVGSLCTGYGGLDLAIGGDTVFVSEIDRDANTVLEQRFPGVPNIGDFTELDSLPDCDVLTAGFPCQPVSQAGKRAGTDDERWLWDDIERVVGGMERPPGILFLENVRGLLSANSGHAMGRVVHGLAGLGYVGRYRVLSAGSVGAPHRRDRVFILGRRRDVSDSELVGLVEGPRLCAVGETSGHSRVGRGRSGDGGREDVSDSYGSGREGRGAIVDDSSRPASLERSPGDALPSFGQFAAAVVRWERIIGRPAPDPVVTDAASDAGRVGDGNGSDVADTKSGPDGGGQPRGEHLRTAAEERNGPRTARLNPRFVEWMMGLPDGWVTDTGISRTAQLRILGNGVVPQQAAHAWHMLTTTSTTPTWVQALMGAHSRNKGRP